MIIHQSSFKHDTQISVPLDIILEGPMTSNSTEFSSLLAHKGQQKRKTYADCLTKSSSARPLKLLQCT